MANTARQSESVKTHLRVNTEAGRHGGAQIALHGCLDNDQGRSLLAAVDAVACDGGTHIRLDLRDITGYTQDGVEAASDCCRMASGLPRGVSFLVSAGTSRDALLEIFARS